MNHPDMSASQSLTQKQRMALTAEMMIKGATLLRESCPKCGAVQIKFQGQTYCTAEDDLERALSPKDVSKPDSETLPKKETLHEVLPPKVEQSPEKSSLRGMLERKLETLSKQLETSNDVEEQSKLLDLISKYVETLEKLGKSA